MLTVLSLAVSLVIAQQCEAVSISLAHQVEFVTFHKSLTILHTSHVTQLSPL